MNQQTTRVINIKCDMPTVEEARRKLVLAINSARADGVQVLKVIHGYGSKGVGGALRDALRKSLLKRRKEGVVSLIVFGEAWGMFNEQARALRDRYPFLRDDDDYNRENPGVTIVELNRADGK
jgi:hypothetical protein